MKTRQLILNKEDKEFLNRYCPDTKCLKKIQTEDKIIVLTNKELENLFWDNLRWIIVEFKPEIKTEVVKTLTDREFKTLLRLIEQAACFKQPMEIISASGLMNRIKLESKRRGMPFDLRHYKLKKL